MQLTDVGFIIPSRNNLQYLELAYKGLRHFYPNNHIVALDDASDDGTFEQLESWGPRDGLLHVVRNVEGERIGHTVLYDVGFETLREKGCLGGMIFHADMVPAQGVLENLLKWWRPKTVVCSTRIEPPLHPDGPEKILVDFGKFPEEFRQSDFLSWSGGLADQYKDQISVGVFAPWLISIDDMVAVGGHDALFAPMELEDSDIFNRWMNAGYKFIQSWDSFVYHFTSRGSRWKDGNIGENSEEYTKLREEKIREWEGRWRQPVAHDPMMLPVVLPVYVAHGFNVPEDYRYLFDSIDEPGPAEFHFPTEFKPEEHEVVAKNQSFFIHNQHVEETVINGVRIVVNKKIQKDMVKPLIKNVL